MKRPRKITLFVFIALAIIVSFFAGRIDYEEEKSEVTPKIEQAFVDVAEEAGLRYIHADLPKLDPKVEKMQFLMSGGAAAGDYDNDGWTDLYVTRLGGAGILYRNQKDGTFRDTTVDMGLARGPLMTNGAAWGDIDNDGDLDLYVTTLTHKRHYLFVNRGEYFEESAIERGAAIETESPHYGYSPTFGDYDKDGYLDLYVTEWGFAGMDSDSAYVGDSHERLLKNIGEENPGYFEDVTDNPGSLGDLLREGGLPGGSSLSFSSRFSDLDHDGNLDLVVASDFGTSKLFWGTDSDSFEYDSGASGFDTAENAMGVTVQDITGDGFQDIFVTSVFDPEDTCSHPERSCFWGSSGNRLYINNGDRTFRDETDSWGVRDGNWGWGTRFFDYDNDGDLDLVAAHGFDVPPHGTFVEDIDQQFMQGGITLWENVGGSFRDVTHLFDDTGTRPGMGLVVFDYDQDGDVDIFLARNGGTPSLYKNEIGNKNDSLRVQVKDGINSIVSIYGPGDVLQRMEIDGGNNFLGQSEPIAHFGLGEGGVGRYNVEVLWPNGVTKTFEHVNSTSLFVAEK